MLVLHRFAAPRDRDIGGHNEIILMHPDAGRIVIRLLQPKRESGVSVAIEADPSVEIQRGELDRAGVNGRTHAANRGSNY